MFIDILFINPKCYQRIEIPRITFYIKILIADFF